MDEQRETIDGLSRPEPREGRVRRRWRCIGLGLFVVALAGAGLWYAALPEWQPGVVLTRVDGQVSAVAFSSDGRLLALASAPALSRNDMLAASIGSNGSPPPGRIIDPSLAIKIVGSVTVWNVAECRKVANFDVPRCDFLAFLVGDRVVAAASSGSLHLRRIDDKELIARFELWTNTRPVASADGTWIAFVPREGGAVVCEAATGRTPIVIARDRLPRALWLSPQGDRLMTASATVRTWDLERTVETASFQVGPGELLLAADAIYFSPDGKTLVVQAGNTVRLWDVATGKKRATLSAPSRIKFTEFSPVDRLLAGDPAGNPVQIWDLDAGKLKTSIEDGMSRINSLSFAHDGRSIVFGGRQLDTPWWAKNQRLLSLVRQLGIQARSNTDAAIEVWDFLSGKSQQYRVGPPEAAVSKVAFSPAGDLLVVCQETGEVTLWDVPERFRPAK